MLRRSYTSLSALASVVAITSYYGFRLILPKALPSGLSIISSDKISDSFAHSFAVSAVNPHHHITIEDTRSVVVTVPNDYSHERILARFLSGFFGGYVFAPERTALRLLGKQLVNFKEMESTPVSTRIWTTPEIDELRITPLHSVLFGAFRIVDIQMLSSVQRPSDSLETQFSHVDVAFGADDGFIAGVHRFSVTEVERAANFEGQRSVTIIYDHTSCNPKENKPLRPDGFQTLHLWYAMLLFREGVANVLKTS